MTAMFKNGVYKAAIFALMLIAISGCGSADRDIRYDSTEGEFPIIVTTIYPIEYFTKRITG